jgi:glycosyltransferase involved in cell wall biosynthesis
MSIDNIINFDKITDCFSRYRDTESVLIYGIRLPFPDLTVFIPTYNRPALLSEALGSVFNQDFYGLNVEVLVVENGGDSGGMTEQIIKSFGQNILYYRNSENIGAMGNWNRGIELAGAEWIAFLHDDDLLAPDYFKTIKAILNRRGFEKKKAGYIMPGIIPFYGVDTSFRADSGGKLTSRFAYKLLSGKRIPLISVKMRDVIIAGSNTVFCAPTCGALVNKSAIIKVGGYNEDYLPAGDIIPPYLMLKEYRVFRAVKTMGYYRWEANDSYKPSTLEGLIRQFSLFSDFLAAKSGYVRFFQKETYADCVDYIVKRGEESGLKLSPEMYDHIKTYRPDKIKRKLFKIINKIHHIFVLLRVAVAG